MEKAFDRVWRLVYKINQNFTKLVGTFIRKRTMRVKVGPSNSRQLEAGLSQVEVLSLFLYSIYTADLPRSGEATPAERTILAMYANDTVVAFKSRRKVRLQLDINWLHHSCIKWKITIKAKKNEAMFLQSTRRLLPENHVVVKCNNIP